MEAFRGLAPLDTAAPLGERFRVVLEGGCAALISRVCGPDHDAFRLPEAAAPGRGIGRPSNMPDPSLALIRSKSVCSIEMTLGFCKFRR